MAASLAKGITTINNAAQEPEVTDLIRCLKKMGAKISGENTSTLVIEGVDHLAALNTQFVQIESRLALTSLQQL